MANFDDRSVRRIRNAVRKSERTAPPHHVRGTPINNFNDKEWHGIIVNTGPNGESDFTDNRYWFRASVCNNSPSGSIGSQTELEDFAKEAISLSVNPNGSDLLDVWWVATHYGESSDESHELTTDGTQYILVKRLIDETGLSRFFFWVRPPGVVMPIGGEFFAAGSRRATGFCTDGGSEWSTAWQSVTKDPGGTLLDWAVYNGVLYACGKFDLYGSSNEQLIYWDGSAWQPITVAGLNPVNCLLVFGGLLYIGGSPTGAGDSVLTYNGSSLSDATGAVGIENVRTLFNWSGTLVAGGDSAVADGYSGIQLLSGSSWGALGSGVEKSGSPGSVYGLAEFNGDLIVCGDFDDAGGVTTDNIASWDGSWSAIGGGINDGIVLCAVEYLTNLYAGGVFGQIKKLGGGGWADVGDELAAYLDSGSTAVWSMCVHPTEDILIVAGKFATREDAIYDHLPCLCVSKYHKVEHTEWAAGTAYAIGAVVSPTGGGDVYHRCIDAGTSGGSEPSWAGLGSTTNDNDIVWLAIESFNHHDYHGGLGGNNTNITPLQSGPSCFKVRVATMPDDDEESLGFVGNFGQSNNIYSRLVALLGRNSYRAAGRGLRLAGTYGGIVRVACNTGNGIMLAGLFDSALNFFGKGDAYYVGCTNVVLFRGGAFYEYGGRSGEQWGGCVFGGAIYLCGETSTARVARKDNPPTWQQNTPYVEGEVVLPTTPNGFQYRCIVAGTSHVTDEPDPWPVIIGHTILDGSSLEWECEASGWTPVGVNLTSGEIPTIASFGGSLWIGGTSINGSYSYATSNGEKNAAGNWTGGSITDVIGIRKFTIGDYGSGERLIAACANITTGAVQVSSGGSFSELGGSGNRITGEANDIVVWTDLNGDKHVMVVGSIQVNGTDCNAADYFSGTWSIVLGTADLLGQVTCVGNWIREQFAVFVGGDYQSIQDLFAANLIGYRLTSEFEDVEPGGASSPVRKIGPTTTFG